MIVTNDQIRQPESYTTTTGFSFYPAPDLKWERTKDQLYLLMQIIGTDGLANSTKAFADQKIKELLDTYYNPNPDSVLPLE